MLAASLVASMAGASKAFGAGSPSERESNAEHLRDLAEQMASISPTLVLPRSMQPPPKPSAEHLPTIPDDLVAPSGAAAPARVGTREKHSGLTNRVRAMVSLKKRRYVGDGYDLDLTYITPRIIAMGFPSEGAEGVYRNPMSEVVSFLETRHREHYMVFNLCSERSYDATRFNRRVQLFPFDDHTPPPLRMMREFCESVHEFLRHDASNVVAIHCKAGKGRTGVMIAAYLLHDRFFTTADDALAFYGFSRTNDCEGVTIPSQRQYVHYYERLTAQPALVASMHERPVECTLVRTRLVQLPASMKDKDKPPLMVREDPAPCPCPQQPCRPRPHPRPSPSPSLRCACAQTSAYGRPHRVPSSPR